MALAHRAKVKDPAKAFISTWRTSIVYTGSTANNQIKLPLEVAGTYKFTVQWGDGTSNLITTWNQAQVTHTYPAPGDYTVTITGYLKGWDWGGGGTAAPTTGDMRKLLTITQFGCLRFVTKVSTINVWSPFFGCTNLNLTGVQDMPNFKGITSIMGLFRACTSLTTVNNINKWDVSKVTFFRNVFRECQLFNNNVGNWNMNNATNIALMFSGNVNVAPYGSFTNGGSDSIKNWDVSKVTDMTQLFYSQRYFNHEIGLWDVSSLLIMTSMLNCYTTTLGVASGTFNNAGSSSIGNWDTSKVITMYGLFSGQPQFNQNISNWNTSNVLNMAYMLQSNGFDNAGASGINNWDVSKVTSMSRMFQGAFAFNQPLNNWNVSLVTDFINFMSFNGLPNAYSVTNYSNLLIGWASRPVQPNRSINFSTNKYNSTAVAARAILTSAPNNWTIADGGLLP